MDKIAEFRQRKR